jgi:hypothetical protein
MMITAITIPTDSARLLSRLRRLPFVVMLTLGLLLSMVHCAGDLPLANSDTTTAAMTNDTGSSHDLPDQLQPAHSGHCLSHVTTATPDAITSPTELSPRSPVIVGDTIPATRDGLPLFKPPRA